MNKALWRNWIIQALGLAVLYFITGKIGLLWAISPGYASAIWPPAGLGTAALLLFGWNLWPGIFIGAFWVAATTGDLPFWAPFGIGIGNTLSLLVASFLIKKALNYPKTFYREKDFILFLLLAGPVAAAISATVGASVLSLAEQIQSGNVGMTWLHWFVGDSIGGIIFAPLALIFSIKSRHFWMKSTATILIPLFVFFGIVIGAIRFLNQVEHDKILADFQKKSEMVLSMTAKSTTDYQSILRTLQSFFENSEDVTAAEFQSFSRTLDINHPEIQALGRARLHNNSYEIQYIEPTNGNEKLVGMDFSAHPSLTQLFEKTKRDNNIFSLAPVILPELGEAPREPFLFLAVKEETGVLFEVVRVNQILIPILAWLKDPSYRVQIQDITESQSLFIADSWSPEGNQEQLHFKDTLRWDHLIEVGGRLWQVSLHHDFSLRQDTRLSTSIFLLATLLFTFLISSLLLAIANSFVTIQEIVKQKTLHLREANIQLEKASRTKSEFLANMSHEIRTPLNVLLGMTDLLEESSLNTEQRHYLDLSRKAGNNLLNIINDILDISKIEAGLLTLEKTEVDIAEVCKEVFDMFALKAQDKGLLAYLRFSEDVGGVYEGDPTRIRQILANLLSNAVKFTSQGSIQVSVLRNQTPDRPGNILIEVTDTGMGIPDDKISQLFRPFTQADSTITRKFGGTGLGLSICKRLTSMMNGDIQVHSTLNKGSTFSFTLGLPLLRKDTLTKKRSESPTSEMTKTPESPLRILIVDDSEDNRTLIKAFLKGTPHEVLEASDGLHALETFKKTHLDLILMDMQMPVMDGFAATAEIRALEKKEHRSATTIWALTAYALKSEIQKSLEVGCNLHLVKPIKRADLLNHIQDLMQLRQKK